MTYNLGFAITFDDETTDHIIGFVENIARSDSLSFQIDRAHALPHISVWQGCFLNHTQVINAVAEAPLPSNMPSIELPAVTVWAKKILFLQAEPRNYFVELQRAIRQAVDPFRERGSADPQDFKSVSTAESASYLATGYPFTEDPFGALLPHITLGHFSSELSGTVIDTKNVELTGLWKNYSSNSTIRADKFIVFEVEPKGACSKIRWAAKLPPR